jgi:NADPH2:quinone reductase
MATIEARAVKITGKGELEALSIGTLAVPDPGPGEIRVAVAAAGLNRADIMQRRGFYAAPEGTVQDVPGLEYAGRVEALGAGVRDFAVGDAVMGIVAGGGMASHLCVHAREAMRVPAGMPLEEAAAIPEVFLTAYDAIFLQARLGMSELLLVHAIGSGIGTAALQLAHAAGAEVVGTSRTQDKLERCRALGLRHGLLVSDKQFANALAQCSGGRLADVILDTVGAAYLNENVAALAPRGRMVVIGLLGGAKGELPLGALVYKRAQIFGSVLRSRPLEEKIALAQSFTQHALPLFAQGKLKAVVERVLPASEIRAAHEHMESNASFGKIVLSF